MALFSVDTSHNGSFYLGITIYYPNEDSPGMGFETKESQDYSREIPREHSHRDHPARAIFLNKIDFRGIPIYFGQNRLPKSIFSIYTLSQDPIYIFNWLNFTDNFQPERGAVVYY